MKATLSTTRNFQNLKTQCYFELQKHIKHISISDESIKDMLCAELDIVVQTNLDKDAKISICAKDEMKEKLGRSPDYADALMMRMYFELDKREPIKEPEEKKNDDPYGIFIDDEPIEDIMDNPY